MQSEWENVRKKIDHFLLSAVIIKEETWLLLLGLRENGAVKNVSNTLPDNDNNRKLSDQRK